MYYLMRGWDMRHRVASQQRTKKNSKKANVAHEEVEEEKEVKEIGL